MPTASPSTCRRVLIVDDDEVITGALYGHLREGGVSVDLAVDGRQAEGLVNTNDYALVVMDAYLTGHLSQRGIDLVEQVRGLLPDVPIIVLTAYDSPQLVDRLARHAGIELVAKPKSVAFLAAMIASALPGE